MQLREREGGGGDRERHTLNQQKCYKHPYRQTKLDRLSVGKNSDQVVISVVCNVVILVIGVLCTPSAVRVSCVISSVNSREYVLYAQKGGVNVW